MVLVQVLIMGALLLILVSFLVRAVDQNYNLASYVVGQTRETKNAEASFGAIYSAWATNANNGGAQNCTSFAWPGGSVTCVGTAGSCLCACSVTLSGVAAPNVKSVDGGAGTCRLTTDTSAQVGQFDFP